MAEEIKGCLRECTEAPRVKPYTCITASRLAGLLEKIKELDFKSFSNVYEYANRLVLPPDFQEEMEFEYEKRGFKS
ncbi:MAG: hypothetical protein ABIE55_00800 [Candidatus Aenigmatarchaeota archaeon]